VHDDLSTADLLAPHRSHLHAVARRMLGSASDAEDAVQEAMLRARAVDLRAIANVRGWLTTVTSRVCLDILRTRARRNESALGAREHTLRASGRGTDPEHEAELVDSVGAALLVVLDRLSPPERVAFVLHDLFAVPFDEIAPVLERSPATTKKLASRARAKVRGETPHVASEVADRWRVVDAFLDAARSGDLDALLAVLAPDVVRRVDGVGIGRASPGELRGADAVAREAARFAVRARSAAIALIDGAPGIVVAPAGRLVGVLLVQVDGDRVAGYEVVGDPSSLERLAIRAPAVTPRQRG
jgi:RNA polymerase sigma factor (sigma-70 family)